MESRERGQGREGVRERATLLPAFFTSIFMVLFIMVATASKRKI